MTINGVHGGHQPIYNEDRTVVVVCNWEICKFHELRRDLEARGHRFKTASDAEVIVHLYEGHYENCVLQLRGMFGLAIWDTRGRQLFLARDRIGIKTLHLAYSEKGNGKEPSLGIVKRKKHPLISPIRDWLRKELPEFAREQLSETKSREAGCFHPGSVHTMLDLHRTGQDYYEFELSCVLAVQLWHDIFLRGSRPAPDRIPN